MKLPRSQETIENDLTWLPKKYRTRVAGYFMEVQKEVAQTILDDLSGYVKSTRDHWEVREPEKEDDGNEGGGYEIVHE